jgi:pre-mRNA-splicing factor ISY1
LFSRRLAPKELDKEGREVASNRGYKYFGAAKDLPGVRELFQKAAEEGELEQPRKNRGELMRRVDADYYGYMDDDDGLLVPLEKIEEQKSINKLTKVEISYNGIDSSHGFS